MKKIILYILLLFITIEVSAQIDRSVQPTPGPSPKINIKSPQIFELKNGLKVLVVENHTLPKVNVTLTIDNMPIFEGKKAGTSDIFSSMLGNGTTKISKDNFHKEVDFLGANLSFSSQGARLNSLSRYFPKVLNLFADAILNPMFTEEDFKSEKNKLTENLKNDNSNIQSITSRIQNALGYGLLHPYGEFTSQKTVSTIELPDIKQFYSNYYKPNNAYLVIIGDVTLKEVKSLISKNFSKWKKGAIPVYPIPETKNVNETQINFVNMDNAVQSNIVVLNSINLKRNSPDYFAALLTNNIFGGGAQGRINLNLREDKGYTYGAFSNIGNNEKTVSLFQASAQVRNMVTDSAVVALVSEIKKIRNTLVTEEELKTAKADYTGNFARNFEKPEVVAAFALSIFTNNLPSDFYTNFLENLNKVTLEDIQQAAQKYISEEQSRIIIVGKAIDVLPSLEKLPYKINYFDKEGNPTTKPDLKKQLPVGVSKETVIENYFNAIGGLDKIKAIKSTLVTYEASAMGSVINSTEKRTTDKFNNKTSMSGAVMANIIMTKEGVSINTQQLPAPMANEMTSMLGTFLEFGLLNNEKSILSGIELVDGNEAYVISTKGEIVSTAIYFDVKSGLKIKESQTVSMGGQNQTQDATYGDYKEFNGIKFPGTKSGALGPQTVEFKLIDAKVNQDVTEADFQ